MKIKKMHIIGIAFGIVILLASVLIYFIKEDINLFFFLAGIGVAVIVLPFVVGITLENQKEQRINQRFLEFTRSLAESVSTGTPISKSIVNMNKKNYGDLSNHIEKLANQINLGIPLDRALITFANDIGSPVISRAVALIREAHKAGGEIDFILDSVAKSMTEIDKLQKERRAAISNLVVQGYIIFFIFIGIILVMQFYILPITSGIGNIGAISGDLTSVTSGSVQESQEVDISGLGRSFLYLLLFQGFFAGLTIGKLSEGTLKSGVKHSFILMTVAFLIASGANVFITPSI